MARKFRDELQPDHILTIRATDSGGEFGEGRAFVALRNGPDVPVLKPQTRKIPENSKVGFIRYSTSSTQH